MDGKAARHVTATRRNEKGEWVFDLDLPEKGEYSLNVFAKEKDNDTEIYNVHTYLVQSDGHEYAEDESKCGFVVGGDGGGEVFVCLFVCVCVCV